jgi:hypothetical protein
MHSSDARLDAWFPLRAVFHCISNARLGTILLYNPRFSRFLSPLSAGGVRRFGRLGQVAALVLKMGCPCAGDCLCLGDAPFLAGHSVSDFDGAPQRVLNHGLGAFCFLCSAFLPHACGFPVRAQINATAALALKMGLTSLKFSCWSQEP